MASPSIDRTRRVGGLIQRELSTLIRTELGDPRVDGVTITDIKLTRDLKQATVFVSRLDEASAEVDLEDGDASGASARGARRRLRNEEDEHEYVGVLNRAAGVLRRHLGSRLSMKSTPNLNFRYDETLERGSRISRLIDRDRPETAG